MKIVKNFKKKKGNFEGFPYIQLLELDDVYLDLPLCAIEDGTDLENPVLYGNINGLPTVYDESEVRELLAHLKMFHLKLDGNTLVEVPEAEAELHFRLPVDTPIDKLIYENGELLLANIIEGDE